MIRLNTADPIFESALSAALAREAYSPDILARTEEILRDVQLHGDEAVLRYVNTIDKANLQSPEAFRVTKAEMDAAFRQTPPEDRAAIRAMVNAVAAFARKSRPKNWTARIRAGVVLGERFEPLSRVGVYIPAGTAPLVSSAAHTAVIAKIAGVKEIAAFTPPRKDGSADPSILTALRIIGVTEVYRLGGVYAIGAAAYGTAAVRKVEKIVGPGNSWVTAAKKCVYGSVDIDMIAGPSEVMVVADKHANARWVAADLFSQLEHGGGNQAILATPSPELIDKVCAEMPLLLEQLTRRTEIENGIAKGLIFIQTRNLKEAALMASRVAPEHLELHSEKPERLLPHIKAAGAVFCGPYTPEPVGDFIAGPSHVLPTAGSARYFSGLSTRSFCRRISVTTYSERALRRELPVLCRIADMEELTAHKLSAAIRFEGEENA